MTNQELLAIINDEFETAPEGVDKFCVEVKESEVNLSFTHNRSVTISTTPPTQIDDPIYKEHVALTDTAYNAFAVPVKAGNEIHIFYTSSSSHIDGGSVVRKIHNILENTFSDEETLFIPSGNDKHFIGLSAGFLGGKIFLFFCNYDKTANNFSGVHDKMYVVSTTTDLNTWGSLTELPFANTKGDPRFNFYGQMIHSSTEGKAFVHWLSHTQPVQDAAMHIIETNDFGQTWISRQIHSGVVNVVSDTFTESAICKIGETKYILLARNHQGKRLGVSISEDDCQTWTDVQETNLGSLDWQSSLDYDGDGDFDPTVTRVKMASLKFDGENLIAFFHDRSDGFLKVSKTPLSQLEQDWTNWNEPEIYSDNRPAPGATTSFREGLGYPNILDTGKIANGKPVFRMFWGLEGSLNRCDILTAEEAFEDVQMNHIRHPENFKVLQDATNNKLSWNAVDNAESYDVFKSTSYDGVYTLLVNVNGLNFDDTLERAYYYVIAKAKIGFSDSHRSLIRQSEL